MRIIIDLQSCQSGSRFRGIGRNAISLTSQMIPILKAHGNEVIVFVSAAYPEEGRAIRSLLSGVCEGVRILEFHVTLPCAAAESTNVWRQRAAELLREYAIACLEPDFVHLSQLVADGWGDDTVTSIGELGVHLPTVLTQHDLIPLVMADTYMPPGVFRDHYLRKLEGLKRADLLLAVSDYTRLEVLEWLGISESDIVNISSAVSTDFIKLASSRVNTNTTLSKYGLRQNYLLYVPGGFDPRKNLDRLFEAYASLPANVRKRHQLVIASKLYPGQRESVFEKAASFGLQDDEFVLTDYVPDEELIDLYRGCYLYVFPSLHEGFGLPVLEAMAFGAPVIASNCTGITEAVGLLESLFDPYSVASIAEMMRRALTDEAFRKRLKAHAAVHPNKFSWEKSAEIAVESIEAKHKVLLEKGWRPIKREDLPSCNDLLKRLEEMKCGVMPDDNDLLQFRQCYEANRTIWLQNPNGADLPQKPKI